MNLSRLFSKFRPNREENTDDCDGLTGEALDLALEASLLPDAHREFYGTDHWVETHDVAEFVRRVRMSSVVVRDSLLDTNSLTPSQKAFAVPFLRELSWLSRSKGTVMSADVLDHLASSIAADEPIAFWQEAWTVPFKIPRRRAVELLEHVLSSVEAAVPFSDLADRGLKRRWAASHMELRSRMRSDSMEGGGMLDALREALMKIALRDDREDVLRICRTMDYAMACMGSRQAMLRLAENIRRVTVPQLSDCGSPPTKARCEELAELADGWRRLSSAVRSAPMGDGEQEFATILAPVLLDLRELDEFFSNHPGWCLPPQNKVPIRSEFPAHDWKTSIFPMRDRSGVPRHERPLPEDPDLSTGMTAQKLQDLVDRLSGTEPMPDPDDALDEKLKEFIEAFYGFRSVMTKNLPRDFSIDAAGAAFALLVQKHVLETTKPLNDDPPYGSEARSSEPGEVSTYDVEGLQGLIRQPVIHEMVVLSGIGASDDTGRTTSDASFARLLAPFVLQQSAVDADKIYLALHAEFPWMGEANELVATAVAKSARTESGAFHIQPTLLHGPAGVGKTRWARRVCELSSVSMHPICMSGVNTTKQIVGSERGWSNARPSLPAYAFLSTQLANPIIYVDEIDKSAYLVSVEDAFLPMIERETAARYHDAYLLGHFNLTAASFIFSANDLSKLSSEFLSRVVPVSVRRPNLREIERTIESIIDEEVKASTLLPEEIARVRESLSGKSSDIFRATGSLREVQNYVAKEAGRVVWSPPGPRLVQT